MFLETLLFNFQNQRKLCLSDLCKDISLSYDISIKKQSLDERFNNNALSFIKRLMEKAVSEFLWNSKEKNYFKAFKRVKIKDSTSFDLPENMSDLFPGNRGRTSNAGLNIPSLSVVY